MATRIYPKDILTPFGAELQTRLQSLDGQAVEHHAALTQIDEERELIKKLIDIERRKKGAVATGKRQMSISEIVSAGLLSGPTTKDALREEAEAQGHQSPSRAIHAILMNFFRHGHVTRASGERYMLTEKGKEALDRKVEGAD